MTQSSGGSVRYKKWGRQGCSTNLNPTKSHFAGTGRIYGVLTPTWGRCRQSRRMRGLINRKKRKNGAPPPIPLSPSRKSPGDVPLTSKGEAALTFAHCVRSGSRRRGIGLHKKTRIIQEMYCTDLEFYA